MTGLYIDGITRTTRLKILSLLVGGVLEKDQERILIDVLEPPVETFEECIDRLRYKNDLRSVRESLQDFVGDQCALAVYDRGVNQGYYAHAENDMQCPLIDEKERRLWEAGFLFGYERKAHEGIEADYIKGEVDIEKV